MTVVTIHQAKTNLSKLIAAVERGEEVVIARRDKVVARIVAAESEEKPKRRFGALKGVISFDDSFFDPMPEDELRLWEGRDD